MSDVVFNAHLFVTHESMGRPQGQLRVVYREWKASAELSPLKVLDFPIQLDVLWMYQKTTNIGKVKAKAFLSVSQHTICVFAHYLLSF